MTTARNARAYISDPHGCIKEFLQLVQFLRRLGVISIRVVGDFCDRGPDSGGIIRYCRENGIDGIFGNHESSIVNQWDRFCKGLEIRNEDKRRTLQQLTQADIDWLRKLPLLHYDEDVNMVSVHGGLWPRLPLHLQPHNVMRAQLIRTPAVSLNAFDHKEPKDRPANAYQSIWWGPECVTKYGKTEEDFQLEGYERWYRIYDGPWNVVYGHSVWVQPHIQKNPGAGTTFGIDTGSCFGGSITALVWDGVDANFVSVKAEKVYAERTTLSLMED